MGRRRNLYNSVLEETKFIATFLMSAGETLTIPSTGNNALYDWGDGSVVENITTDNPSHLYTNAGTYQLTIDGLMTGLSFYNKTNDNNLIYIQNLGSTGLLSLVNTFRGCTNLVSVEGYFDGSVCTDMAYTFLNCTSLESFDNINWDTSTCVNFIGMFLGNSALTTLDISNFDVSAAGSLVSMIEGCVSLTTIDIDNWSVSGSLARFAKDCTSLQTVICGNFTITGNNVNMGDMFSMCISLTSLDVSNWNMTPVNSLYQFVFNCSNLTILDVSGWDISNVTLMTNAFRGTSIVIIDTTNWNTSNLVDCQYMLLSQTTCVSHFPENVWWGNSNITSYTLCFSGAINIDNYNNIPNDWK